MFQAVLPLMISQGPMSVFAAMQCWAKKEQTAYTLTEDYLFSWACDLFCVLSSSSYILVKLLLGFN